jgi:hypothetical protein
MDGHYHDDPIENYEYFGQENCFSGRLGSYVNHDIGDLYVDEEFGNYMRILTFLSQLHSALGLSSPSPFRVLEPSQNRLYPNYCGQTVGSGMNRQHHGSENQQKGLRGFQSHGSSPGRSIVKLLSRAHFSWSTIKILAGS